jgi:hypothetical protein
LAISIPRTACTAPKRSLWHLHPRVGPVRGHQPASGAGRSASATASSSLSSILKVRRAPSRTVRAEGAADDQRAALWPWEDRGSGAGGQNPTRVAHAPQLQVTILTPAGGAALLPVAWSWPWHGGDPHCGVAAEEEPRNIPQVPKQRPQGPWPRSRGWAVCSAPHQEICVPCIQAGFQQGALHVCSYSACVRATRASD